MKLNTVLFYTVALMLMLWGCDNEYKPLFNGKSLNGWEAKGPGKWYVENGFLTGENDTASGNSYLYTIDDYDNFELLMEFKEEIPGEFGIFFHTDISTDSLYGWKVVVAPLNGGTGSIYEQNGRGWLERIPEQKEKLLKENDWNRLRIKVERGHVTTWLNGYLMVDYTDSKINKGMGGIAFQIPEQSRIKIRLRNIKIKVLDELEKVNQYI
ncbi:MAG: DUF1080 domain-containing protein [Chlorobi bacterium]|nr:DUF1080 domain-containing protein [Chlorobiota bacterium]